MSSPGAPGRIREGSSQQDRIWDELLTGRRHLMVEARAGCGKSSTCREGIYRLFEDHGSVRCAYVAFNASIASEFNVGLPPKATATTMHSAGFCLSRPSGRELIETWT